MKYMKKDLVNDRPTGPSILRDQLIGYIVLTPRGLPQMVCCFREGQSVGACLHTVYEDDKGDAHLSKNSLFALTAEEIRVLQTEGRLQYGIYTIRLFPE